MPAFAIDPDYEDFTFDPEPSTMYYFGGDWDHFYPTSGHPNEHTARYRNEFASTMGRTASHEYINFEVTLEDNMKSAAGYGYKYVYMCFYADPESENVGASLKIETRVLDYSAWLYLGWADGTHTEEYYVSDFRDWKFEFHAKIALGIDVSGDRGAYVSCRLYKEDISTEDEYFIGDIDLFFAGDALRDIEEDCDFVHEVTGYYGTTMPTGDWDAYFTIHDIGTSTDIVDSDCDVDMYDVVAVTGIYGSDLNTEGWSTWLWGGNYWKADHNVDLEIDIFDTVFITNAYPDSW